MSKLKQKVAELMAAAGLVLGGSSASAILPAPPPMPACVGRWTISSSQRAPWKERNDPFGVAEAKRLVGARLLFARDRIAAPAPLACRRPHYEMHGYDDDMLFQGSLTAPMKQASALGFTTLKVWTLETGCAGMIDFHFVDTRVAMFALNNQIYTIRRSGR